MSAPTPRQVSTVILLAALGIVAGACSPRRSVVLGFWFEPVTYTSTRFGVPVTAEELKTIETVARAEVRRAFSGLRVTLSDESDARYRVRVIQHLADPRFRSDVAVAGASRVISRFGGDGAVNFSMLAAYAESYAPAGADRATIVTAIGRGIGRAAVHEFAHQLLGDAAIDRTADKQTYEYGSADRREQYYGEMRWGDAWSALHKRLGAGPPQ